MSVRPERRRRIALSVVAAVLVAVGAVTSAPARPDPAGAVDTSTGPAVFATVDVRGGYVASGVGLRNRGAGSITVTGIPPGATVARAFLVWSILGGSTPGSNFATGKVNGSTVTGTLAGSGPSPCWTPWTVNGYAYRAEVTSLVTGNGSYALSGFASGRTDGADPFFSSVKAPLAEGASLVVVYSKAAYPLTRVLVAAGYHMTYSTQTAGERTFSWGFPASVPVGEVRTTFIGADGQLNFAEPTSTFAGKPVAAADWDGTDGPSPRYSYGNLWDTDTASVGASVTPGATGATIRVVGGGPAPNSNGECMAWIGQAVSIGQNGAADTDGDALRDGWEANGYDANGDGVADIALPGASVVHRDVFVEMDYMGAQTTCPCILPPVGDLDRIRAVFATAPVLNPDGYSGITLHLDAGPARGASFNLGGGNLVPFDADLAPSATEFAALKAKHFDPRRAPIYRYMVWANRHDGGTTAGRALSTPGDSFLVTLGGWTGGGSSDAKVATFAHELGHTFGLRHGGNDDIAYKPNYLSVMNPWFQSSGVPRTSGAAYFGYAVTRPPDLVESSLKETIGVASSAATSFRTKWWCPNGTVRTSPGTVNGPLDWNCDGVAGGTVSVNLTGPATTALTTLVARSDWATLVYGGGAVGGTYARPVG